MTERSTYVSVDWDGFVPEPRAYDADFGHQESPLYLTDLWKFRMHHHMRTDGRERDFWRKLWDKLPLPVNPFISVSDSHLSVWFDPALHVADTVVLIDQHHDMFGDGTEENIDCGNWLSVWLRHKKNRRAIWVMSPHTVEQFLPAGPKHRSLTKRVVLLDSIDQLDPNQMPNPTVHVCRSGCWTPPWLDERFIRFVKGSGLMPIQLPNDIADPMLHRLTRTDYQEGLRHVRQMKEFMRMQREQRT